MSIQAIETTYAGVHFRSRLEARWAVFMDTVGIGWEFEPTWLQVRVMRQRHNWLPDFRLDDGRWAEVKGALDESGVIRYLTLAYFVGGCGHGNDTVLLGHIPAPSRELWPIQLHRCRDGMMWAVPWTLEQSCPVDDGMVMFQSDRLGPEELLAGMPWGQPDWAAPGLEAALTARF